MESEATKKKAETQAEGSKMGILIYKFIERIDGEKGLKILPYKVGQRIKIFCLLYLIGTNGGAKMKIAIITSMVILSIIGFGILKSAEKTIDDRNAKIEETYKILGIGGYQK